MTPLRSRLFALLLPLGLPCAPSLAIEGEPNPFFGEVPLVLTASRLVQTPFDAPAPITVIDRALIEASGFTELHDLLRLVPGFIVADWPGGSPTVANHGLGDAYGRRLKVLIDGRTVNNPFWGNVHWQDLPIRVDDVERVEVVRGPHGAAYGANAFQGVINIVTRSPLTENGNSVILRGGDREMHDLGVRINGGEPGTFDWRLSASRRRADNFLVFNRSQLESIERNVANLQAEFQPGLHDRLRLQLGATVGYNHTGYLDNAAEPLRNDRVRDNYLQLSWQRAFSPDSELSVHYYHQDRAERAAWQVATPIGTVPYDRDLDIQRDDLEIQHSHRFSPEWQLMWGGGVRRDVVSSDHYLGNGAESGVQWQLFGSVTWSPSPAWQFNLGGMFEDHYYSGELFSPRLAINYHLSPLSVLRASTGVAYRAPSAWEARSFETTRYQDKIIALGYGSVLPVDPERVRFTEFGYVAHWPQWGLQLDARVFREDYTDYIDDQACYYPPSTRVRKCSWAPPANLAPLSRNPGTFYFDNIGGVRMDGIELRTDWKRPGWGRIVFSQAFIDIDEGPGNPEPDMVKSSPSTMSSLLLIKELPARWRASLGFYHADSMYWLNDGDRVPSRGRTDLKLAKTFQHGSQEHELAFTVQSLEGDYPDFHEGRYRHQARAFVTLKLAL